MRLLVAFAIMGLLLYGLYYFLKRFGKKITGQEGANLKVLSKVRIDSRNSIALIQFHEEELLLSVNSAGGMRLLTKCAQIDLAEAEANDSEVEENSTVELPAVKPSFFNLFGGIKGSSAGIKTVKDAIK